MDADYTARAQEMWARAFEAYIYDTLQARTITWSTISSQPEG